MTGLGSHNRTSGPPLHLLSSQGGSLSSQQQQQQQPPPRFQPGGGITPPASAQIPTNHYSSSLLNPANKFNTIHSSGNKRPLPSINHYESAAEAKLGSGKDPAYYARGRDNVNHHMSTLGRSSSMRAKDPLLSGGPGSRHHDRGDRDLGGVVGTPSSSNGSSSNDNSSGSGLKGQQVVDSAYGTTRSVKKVYL